ncbi:MAG: hypothetical protein COW08_06290 [Ignavibacteriales bacterium CG12_big_fil_rev_8_21_14_0_65_30_8]|nr:MAG: hypothetical protein COW08_06290 [Ignavibacteriales bacterium CG12_big_fil_rev_8_21_14_0_65_30_8]
MIYYKVNISLNKNIENKWLDWMNKIHVPEVLNTGYFLGHKILKNIQPENDQDKVEYTIMYECESINKYLEYSVKAAPELQKKHTELFKGTFTANREILEAI